MDRRLAAILAADVVGYSRLMEDDEVGTLQRLTTLRVDLIEPVIKKNHGRIVKLMGDGFLVEFRSAVDAVECAVDWQNRMAEGEEGDAAVKPLQFRIGINLGDVIVEDEDIYGDGVNVAARLEGLAEPAGVCISDAVHQSVKSTLDFTFDDIGLQLVKNISTPIRAWKWRAADPVGEDVSRKLSMDLEQDIRFCVTPDEVSIAYACVGDGPPLVKAANWLNHLEYDWQSPVWRHLIRDLSSDHYLVRYDERGTGLSDWKAEDLSFEAWVSDLESVVDTLGLDRFALLGISQGCPVSIAYAARHPERVTHLVLHGGYARGWRTNLTPDAARQHEAMVTLIKEGWGQATSAFRQIFTSLMIPEGSAEEVAWFNELERISTSPENAAQLYDNFSRVDVSDLLPRVSAPTLVLHSRDDPGVPYKAGRRMASMIPGAKFITLQSRNHLILEHEPAYQRFITEIKKFLSSNPKLSKQ